MSKRPLFFTAVTLGLVLFACGPKEHLVDCNADTGSFICFNGEGRDGIYARWNFDTVETYNTFNIQGSYTPTPGTKGPWTTINISMVNSMGNMAMENGPYVYQDWLANEGEKQFTFYVRAYLGDALDPEIKNYRKKNPGSAILNITGMDGSGNLSGVFNAELRNIDDFNDSAQVKFYFTDIPVQ